MNDFFRFPHTPHIAWLGPGVPRNDKILTPHELRDLLRADVVVEEKVDGANLGFSVGEDGTLYGQNRGTYLDIETPQGQWKPLKRWLAAHQRTLVDALWPDLVLFGEWCFAVHGIRYTHLPDWFLAFDIYDRATGDFWSARRRNDLLNSLDICAVPELGRGHQTLESLKTLLTQSRLTDGPAEGLYVRQELGGLLKARAKLVRAEFVQAIEQHWSKRQLEENQLANGESEAR